LVGTSEKKRVVKGDRQWELRKHLVMCSTLHKLQRGLAHPHILQQRLPVPHHLSQLHTLKTACLKYLCPRSFCLYVSFLAKESLPHSFRTSQMYQRKKPSTNDPQEFRGKWGNAVAFFLLIGLVTLKHVSICFPEFPNGVKLHLLHCGSLFNIGCFRSSFTFLIPPPHFE
jgi:hypothetical protein